MIEDLIFELREGTFHMTDEEAKKVIHLMINEYPIMLSYYTLEWYYKNC